MQAWKVTFLSTCPTSPKSHNLLANPINYIEVTGHFIGPLRISDGPTYNSQAMGRWAGASFHPCVCRSNLRLGNIKMLVKPSRLQLACRKGLFGGQEDLAYLLTHYWGVSNTQQPK